MVLKKKVKRKIEFETPPIENGEEQEEEDEEDD